MKFLVPNYSCLQKPWLGGLPPSDPRSLCPLSSTEFVEPPTPSEQNSWVRHWLFVKLVMRLRTQKTTMLLHWDPTNVVPYVRAVSVLRTWSYCINLGLPSPEQEASVCQATSRYVIKFASTRFVTGDLFAKIKESLETVHCRYNAPLISRVL